MPKERRDKRSSSPCPFNSKNADKNKAKTQSLGVDDEKEWSEVKCPICMEHPHNAVLLKCSSHEKGCRPYMCNTSYRHSNCLDQFVKQREQDSQVRKRSKVVCPLCRGKIIRWVVMEPARKFMNSKSRSCPVDKCDFVGNYSQLRKHARCEHPYVQAVDPTRQPDWDQTGQELRNVLEDERGGGRSRLFGDNTRYVDELETRGNTSVSQRLRMVTQATEFYFC